MQMRCFASIYLFLAVWLCPVATAVVDATAWRTQENGVVSEELFSALDELARIVDVSYCVGNTGVRKPFQCLGRCGDFEGFELIKTWHTGPLLSDSCGFMALSHPPWPRRIILGFRGTYSLTNTLIDLAAAPQAYSPYNNTVDDDGSECTNCTVHTGFLLSWYNARREILPELSAARAKYPDYSLVLTGHSLGGAVAALAGLEFSVRGWSPHVTTFGEPRIGNAALATYVNERFNLPADRTGGCVEQEAKCSTYHRVTHVNDPVPLLPFEEWGYAPHAGEIYISKIDVPPDLGDVHICQGNEDPACIAGQEDTEDQVRNTILSEIATYSADDRINPDISSSRSEYQYGMGDEDQIRLSPATLPRRLQLWELLFSHRDYFWRLGVCLPHIGEGGNDSGGDDGGRGSTWHRWWDKLKKKFKPWTLEQW